MPTIEFELPTTLTAEVSSVPTATVDLYFGNALVKSWPITEDQADGFREEPFDLELFVADKLAALFGDET